MYKHIQTVESRTVAEVYSRHSCFPQQVAGTDDYSPDSILQEVSSSNFSLLNSTALIIYSITQRIFIVVLSTTALMVCVRGWWVSVR